MAPEALAHHLKGLTACNIKNYSQGPDKCMPQSGEGYKISFWFKDSFYEKKIKGKNGSPKMAYCLKFCQRYCHKQKCQRKLFPSHQTGNLRKTDKSEIYLWLHTRAPLSPSHFQNLSIKCRLPSFIVPPLANPILWLQRGRSWRPSLRYQERFHIRPHITIQHC